VNEPLAKLQRIPGTVASVEDYEPLARERMSAAAWAYVAGGAADEVTLRDNRAAFQRLRLRSRVLQDLRHGTTGIELFGQSFPSPILLAPVAYQRLAHPDGELASVAAASAIGMGMVVSTQASVALEDIVRQAATPLWFQLYIQPDRGFTRDLVARAEAAGYSALVVTADAPVSGIRNREQRAGFALPPGVEAVNLRGMAQPAGIQATATGALIGSTVLAAAPTWNDIGWLRAQTRLPILIKGVMTGEDGARAAEEGASGVVVSNHGGRTLDTQPAAIDVLPEVVAAVQGRLPVLMDGGIRRGTDVVKALALGARAVMVGRPYVFGLAAAGALGVAHVLRILQAELEVAMALTGCVDIAALNPDMIRRVP